MKKIVKIIFKLILSLIKIAREKIGKGTEFVKTFNFGFDYRILKLNYEEKSSSKLTDGLLGADIIYDDNGELIDPDVELEGLGRMFRHRNYNSRQAFRKLRKARHHYRMKMFHRNKKSIVTSTQRFIVGNKSKYDAVTQKMLSNNELKFSDKHIYFMKAYSSIGGNITIIQANDNIGTGYSNLLENGVVPKGEILAVKYIALSHNDFLTETSNIFEREQEAVYNVSNGLSASEVELLVNNKVVLTIPTMLLRETRNANGTQSSDYLKAFGYNLEFPILIKPDDRVNFNLKTPENSAIPILSGRSMGLRFVLSGSGTKIR